MSDQPVRTVVLSSEGGALPFQDYFVRLQCRPQVKGFHFVGCEEAHPAPGVLAALQGASAVILCPSNPWVSIDPILSVPGMREALVQQKEVARLPILAVTPIIRGETIKGPAAKMYAELGIQPSALAVARHYRELITGFVLDAQDENLAADIADLGIKPLVTGTIMKTPFDRERLAQQILAAEEFWA
jgi:LPPG:FO 2-phospho-L-lactate transferase